VAVARRAILTRTAGRMWWLPLIPLGFLTDRSLRWRWLLMPAIVIVTALTSSVAKLVIRRPRPGSAHHRAPLGHLGAASFPSTHSACAFAIAGWLRASRHGRGLHAVALLIGYVRVRCRAHHFVDVLAGAILGYGIVWQSERGWSRLVSPREVDVVKSTGDHRRIRSSKQRTIGPTPHKHSARVRDHITAPADHGLSFRSFRRHKGASSAYERRSAEGGPLEVS
jgi:hypothetical protein